MTCQACYNGPAIAVMAKEHKVKTIKVPRLFYEDHAGRAANEGDARWITSDRNTVTLEADDAAVKALLKDAEWYADKRNHDTGWPALTRSAKATVQRLTA